MINAGISIKGEKSDNSAIKEEAGKSDVKTSAKKVSPVKGPGHAKMAKPSSAKISAPTKTGSQRGN